MKRILLDTSAYSAFMRGRPEVIDLVQEADEIHLSSIVLGELLAGFARGDRRVRNEHQLGEFVESPRVSLIDVDDDTAVRYAVIYNVLRDAGTPIPIADVWIAASAMQHGLSVVTLDAHFQRVPQILTHFIE
jgi:tRNA(fMet)-specific endonuclease VapC